MGGALTSKSLHLVLKAPCTTPIQHTPLLTAPVRYTLITLSVPQLALPGVIASCALLGDHCMFTVATVFLILHMHCTSLFAVFVIDHLRHYPRLILVLLVTCVLCAHFEVFAH